MMTGSDGAIDTLKSINTDARITPIGVMTCGSILAYVRPCLGALIEVICTVTSVVLRGAVAGVIAYSIDATASVLA